MPLPANPSKQNKPGIFKSFVARGAQRFDQTFPLLGGAINLATKGTSGLASIPGRARDFGMSLTSRRSRDARQLPYLEAVTSAAAQRVAMNVMTMNAIINDTIRINNRENEVLTSILAKLDKFRLCCCCPEDGLDLPDIRRKRPGPGQRPPGRLPPSPFPTPRPTISPFPGSAPVTVPGMEPVELPYQAPIPTSAPVTAPGMEPVELPYQEPYKTPIEIPQEESYTTNIPLEVPNLQPWMLPLPDEIEPPGPSAFAAVTPVIEQPPVGRTVTPETTPPTPAPPPPVPIPPPAAKPPPGPEVPEPGPGLTDEERRKLYDKFGIKYPGPKPLPEKEPEKEPEYARLATQLSIAALSAAALAKIMPPLLAAARGALTGAEVGPLGAAAGGLAGLILFFSGNAAKAAIIKEDEARRIIDETTVEDMLSMSYYYARRYAITMGLSGESLERFMKKWKESNGIPEPINITATKDTDLIMLSNSYNNMLDRKEGIRNQTIIVNSKNDIRAAIPRITGGDDGDISIPDMIMMGRAR